jgi:uncharacterized protein
MDGFQILPLASLTELLVVQPTTFCNIDCSYCYLPDRSSKRRMKLDTVELIGSRLLQSPQMANDVTAIWHAGEPLVMSTDWYRQAFSILARNCPPRVRLTHAIQTNGTLIDSERIRLFKEYDVRVGVSIDGPSEIHNTCRRNRNGGGTFDRTLAGLRRLRDAGVPFHVITVLTANSLLRADEIFDFYLAEGIDRVCFNIEEIEGANSNSSLATRNSEAAYRGFLARFLARAAAAPRPIWIREIAASVATVLTPTGTSIPNQQVEPLAIVVVDVEGNLSTFSPELIGTPSPEYGDFRFVNLREGGLEQLLASPAFHRAHAAIQTGVGKCRLTCPWFQWCGGGAPANKLFETGSMTSAETLYCRLTKQAVMETVLTAIEAGTLLGAGRQA